MLERLRRQERGTTFYLLIVTLVLGFVLSVSTESFF